MVMVMAPVLVIVNKIYIKNLTIPAAKDDPPVARNFNRPETFQFAFQRMESVAWKIEIRRIVSDIQPSQNILDTIQMIVPQLLTLATFIKSFQTAMLKASNHFELYRVSVH